MTRTPATQRILDLAVEHFAERGYDGSSLGDIAEAAGIRKASLYSHFNGKDDLVAQILAIALDNERTFASKVFASDTGELRGEDYLSRLADQFATSPELRFLLRTAYAPPIAIREEIVAAYATVNDHVRELFTNGLNPALSATAAATLAEGYLGAVDAIQVELLYGEGGTVEPRRKALWELLTSYASAPPAVTS